jgi:hypothetical protein
MRRITDRCRQELADRAKAMAPDDVRRTLVTARLWGRNTTARWRGLPDALIIGGQRCGTSSLYKWLGRHPNAAPSLRKEIGYFSVDHAKGEGWYRAHFPLTLRRRAASVTGRPLVTFEATPDYLFDPRAPERARALVPEAKLIALLRDPTDRAVSHFHLNVRLRDEWLDLEDALRVEDERLGDEWARVAADPNHRAIALRRFSYVARGSYAEQLERWLAVYSRRQLLVLRSEDLYAQPAETYRRILGFLDLPAWEPPEFRNYSFIGPFGGTYPDPPDTVRRFLADRLAEPNRRLVDLLGEEFRWDAPATGGQPLITPSPSIQLPGLSSSDAR